MNDHVQMTRINYTVQRKGREITIHRGYWRFRPSKYAPHQGNQECARRKPA